MLTGCAIAKKVYAINGTLKKAQSIISVFFVSPLLETKYPAPIEPKTKEAAPTTPYNTPISEVLKPNPPSTLAALKNKGVILMA